MIPFTVQIPQEKVDRNLKYKLQAELPAIFRWAVEGCLLYQQEGLTMPKAVSDCVKEYRKEMDVISAFIDDRCELKNSVKASVLYAVYSKWTEENNEYRMSSTKFGVEMSKRFEKRRLYIHASRNLLNHQLSRPVLERIRLIIVNMTPRRLLREGHQMLGQRQQPLPIRGKSHLIVANVNID